jgi:putative ABC transport system permease protein
MSRLSRFTNLWRNRALDAEFDDELRFHYEMRVEKNLKRGMSRADAELEARRHLGSPLRAKEGMREARIMMWIETLLRDLSYGARMLRRQPSSTLLALVTLSLGIGANAVIYSLLHAALIQPLPYPDADRLVAIVDNFRTEGRSGTPPTVPELLDVRAASRTLESMSFYDARDAQINGGTEPARAVSARIEAGFFATLGAQPALGRLFSPGDHQDGRDRVVILSDAFWRRTFGGDPAVIDRNIIVNGSPHTVVGVLPPGVNFDYFTPEPIELYVPFPMIPLYTLRTGDFANVRRVIAIGRLNASSTPEQAEAELQAISQRIRTDHPELYRRGSDGQDLGFSMGAPPLREFVVGNGRPIVLLLFGAVGLVLLIACVNTAQFLLARAVERQPEVVIRSALGAGTGRLLRQFLTEAFLLSLIAGVLGLAQATLLVDLLRAVIDSPSPLAAHFSVNVSVIYFTIGVAGIVTLACGLFPAIHLVRSRVVIDNSRLAGNVRTRTRHVMIATQVAVSVILLISAAVLVEGLRRLQNAPRGYDADDVTVMRMRIAGGTPGASGNTYQEYLRQIESIPGIAHAAFADAPLPGSGGVEFSVIGRPDDAATLTLQRAAWRIVSPWYFGVLEIPIVAGRSFSDGDTARGLQVAIINQHMATRFWPDQNPIGQQIRSGEGPRARVLTIVGIAGDVRPAHRLDTVPQIYVSYLQQSEPNITLLVRPQPGLDPPIDQIKRAIWSVRSAQPLYDIQPLTRVIDRTMAEARLMTGLLGGFAVLAVLMSTMGVYTVVSYLTARRTKEVALRRAIGASAGDVFRLLGVPTMRWTLFGMTIGMIGAVAAATMINRVGTTFDMPPDATRLEPSALVLTGILYLLVVGVAVVIPAARALRIQPSTILRAD